MISFDLNNGRNVYVDALYYDRTYSGLLEGKPTKQVNDAILEDLEHRVGRIWSDRRHHIIPPVIDDTDPEHPQLPPVIISVMLTSFKPVKNEADSSLLVVSFFCDEITDKPLPKIIYENIRTISWDDLAEDFYW